MPATFVFATIRKTPRPFVAAALVLAMLAPAASVRAQDALSERYRAIREPGQALEHRTARQRLQAELNALERAWSRARLDLRDTERLRFQDPVSALPAQEQALRAELDRIDSALRAATAALGRFDRPADPERPLVPDLLEAGDVPSAQRAGPGAGSLSPEQASIAARAFVDGLLRANRARP